MKKADVELSQDSVATQPADSGGAQAYAANAQANSEGAQANAAGAQAK